MKKIYTAAIFIIPYAPSCQKKETLTNEEVVAAIQQFDKGWKEKNAKTVDSVLSTSYIYFTQSGEIFERIMKYTLPVHLTTYLTTYNVSK